MDMTIADRTKSICPYLGMMQDETTSLAYASTLNGCYHCAKPAIPNLEHQKEFCLSAAYPGCKVFLQSEHKEFPRELKGKSTHSHAHVRRLWITISGIVVLIAAGLAYFLLFPNLWSKVAATPTMTSTRRATPTREAAEVIPTVIIPDTGSADQATEIEPTSTIEIEPSSTVEIVHISSPTRTVPSATPTKTVKPVTSTATISPTVEPTSQLHGLEKAFTVDGHDFLLHRVLEGEGYDFLALKFHTTPSVLVDLNYDSTYPIWTGSIIVVSPGMLEKDVKLPSFRVYQINGKATSMNDLAMKINGDLTLLKHFNRCDDSCNLNPGDWILVPLPD
jgi:hypothetical protein